MTCTCTPGTFEDGWQEQRGEECLAEERAAWSRLFDLITAGNILNRRIET